MAVTIENLLSEKRHQVIRKLHMKRRQTSGEYEASFQRIEDKYVKNWGQVRWELDSILPGEYKQSGLRLVLRNDDAYFNDQSDADSFWSGYLTRNRTLVKVEAGYLDSATSDTTLPTDPAIFLGIIADDIGVSDKNEISLQVDTLDRIFREVPADKLSLTAVYAGLTLTAENVVRAIRDWTDGSGNLVFQKYITSAAWFIDSTTADYPVLNTSSSEAMKNLTMWDVMKKLAQAENKVVYIKPNGNLYFTSRTAPTTTAVYRFAGVGAYDTTYGHNIESLDAYEEKVSRIYNRIRVKFADGDTSTSFSTTEEAWGWGDSTTSNLYGVRTFTVDNKWIGNAANASTIGNRLSTEYKTLKYELRLTTKFIPQVFLSDIVEVTYKAPVAPIQPLWGEFLWGHADWGARFPRGFKVFEEKRMQVLELTHDLNAFRDTWVLREE